jgi:hypothetical protein
MTGEPPVVPATKVAGEAGCEVAASSEAKLDLESSCEIPAGSGFAGTTAGAAAGIGTGAAAGIGTTVAFIDGVVATGAAISAEESLLFLALVVWESAESDVFELLSVPDETD